MTPYEQQACELAERCAKYLKREYPSLASPEEYITNDLLRELSLPVLLEDKARLDWMEKQDSLQLHQPSNCRTAITNAMKEEK